MNWDWFLSQGIWLLVTLAIAAVAYFALRRWAPRGVRAIMRRMKALGTEKELESASRTISRVLVWLGTIVIVAGLVLGILPRFGVNISPVTTAITDWLLSHGIRILIIVGLAIIVHQIGKRVIPRVVDRPVRKRGKGRPVEEVEQRVQTLSRFLSQIAIGIIWIVAAFMILSEIGVNITPLLAAAGVIGIAIGFGAQSLIRDVLNGFFIILEDQYAEGDWISVGGVSGEVESMGLRRTILRDLDGVCHTIPNGDIKIASNWTKDWGRVNLNIPVAYGEDLDHAIEVLNRVCQEMAGEEYWHSRLLSTPKVLRVDNLGDSGIEIKVLGETKVSMQWEVMSELRKRIKKAFDEEGIEIPWPHMKVYFGEASKRGPRGEEKKEAD